MTRGTLQVCSSLIAFAFLALAGCTEPAPGPGSDLGADDDASASQPTADGGAPALIDPSVLGGGDDATPTSGGEAAPPEDQPEDPMAAATQLALSTAEVPSDVKAQQDLMARSGEGATLGSADIKGLASFLADASRIDQQAMIEVDPLSGQIEADPDLIEDPEWLAGALRAVEAAGRVGRTIETGLDGPEWPADMRVLVEQTIRGQIVVPMIVGSSQFRAATQTDDPVAAAEALKTVRTGVAGLVAALEQMPTLMLAAERATQTAEAP